MPKAKAASAEVTKKAKNVAARPTYDDIALRAYHIYLERGCTSGDPMRDWLRAERELTESPKPSRRKAKIVPVPA